MLTFLLIKKKKIGYVNICTIVIEIFLIFTSYMIIPVVDDQTSKKSKREKGKAWSYPLPISGRMTMSQEVHMFPQPMLECCKKHHWSFQKKSWFYMLVFYLLPL